jgi:hypothetical protein
MTDISTITKKRHLKVTNHPDQLNSCPDILLTRLANIRQLSWSIEVCFDQLYHKSSQSELAVAKPETKLRNTGWTSHNI